MTQLQLVVGLLPPSADSIAISSSSGRRPHPIYWVDTTQILHMEQFTQLPGWATVPDGETMPALCGTDVWTGVLVAVPTAANGKTDS